jgi:hypothetical protein
VLHLLGVGGYRAGFLWLALLLAGAGGGLTFVTLPSVPRRTVWVLAVVILGVTAASALVERAPQSGPRLAQRLDGIDLPFFTVVRTETTGHGWCRPHCPRVRRSYRTPSAAPRANELTILLALQQARLLAEHVIPPPLPHAGRPLTFSTDDVTVLVTVGPGRATVELASRRPSR